MSDYISKQSLLDYLVQRDRSGDGSEELWLLEQEIKSGSLDSSDQGEAARLREVLNTIIKEASKHCSPVFAEHIKMIANRTRLSEDTEPVGAQRVQEQFQMHSDDESYQAGVRDALSCLGISIPGINTGEGKQ